MEHLQALHHSYTHPANTSHTVPLDREAATRLSQPPEGVNRDMWLYELCRFLIQRVNSIIIALFADDPACSANTCPEMRASEWQYLCAVHDPPKSCCAIDYCCHTLDWAANILTSPKQFPSRLALGTENNSAQNQVRQLNNIFRRVYRIFAHAWFQHREVFWKVENESGLYILFKTVCEYYSIMGEDNFTIPPEAEGTDATPVSNETTLPTLLRREDEVGEQQARAEQQQLPSAINDSVATGNTTRRHKHTPSSGGVAVSTVIEEADEDEGNDGQMEEVPLGRDDSLDEPAPQPPAPAAAQANEVQAEPLSSEPIVITTEIETSDPEPATSRPAPSVRIDAGEPPALGEADQPAEEAETPAGAAAAGDAAPVESAEDAPAPSPQQQEQQQQPEDSAPAPAPAPSQPEPEPDPDPPATTTTSTAETASAPEEPPAPSAPSAQPDPEPDPEAEGDEPAAAAPHADPPRAEPGDAAEATESVVD